MVLEPNEDHLPDLRKYFSDLEQKKIKLPVKVMLLGNHASGKTTFWHHWENEEFPSKKIPSTHVLNVHRYPQDTQLPVAMVYDMARRKRTE